MDLFELVNGRVVPSVHALLIEPFKTIWEEDESDSKEDAINKFTLIELMCSKKKSNPYKGYPDKERAEKICKNIFGDHLEVLDDVLVIGGIEVYKEFLYKASPSLSYLEASLESAEKVKHMLRNVDFDERTNGGAAVYKPGDITKALKETSEVVKSLMALQEKVENELLEDAKTRGSREIGHFER